MRPSEQISKIRETHEAVNEAGAKLESIVNQTALSLDDALNFSYPVDVSTTKMIEEIEDHLNISTRKTKITSDTTTQRAIMTTENSNMNTAQTEMKNHTDNKGKITNPTLYNIAKDQFDEAQEKYNEAKAKIQSNKTEENNIKKFDT